MIKYFHELTKEEYKDLVDSGKYTYEKLAEGYPGPKWCDYGNPTDGIMGCWSLMYHLVTGEEYCMGCDCYTEKYDRSETV